MKMIFGKKIMWFINKIFSEFDVIECDVINILLSLFVMILESTLCKVDIRRRYVKIIECKK